MKEDFKARGKSNNQGLFQKYILKGLQTLIQI